MTPKEKAIELYNYYNSVETPSEMNGKGQINLVRLSYLASKQCALIAVNEVISDNASIYSQQYWNEVKNEINKL